MRGGVGGRGGVLSRGTWSEVERKGFWLIECKGLDDE